MNWNNKKVLVTGGHPSSDHITEKLIEQGASVRVAEIFPVAKENIWKISNASWLKETFLILNFAIRQLKAWKLSSI